MTSLDDYIAAHGQTKFKWGEFDCAHFAAGWVRQHTGEDKLLGLGHWVSARAANRKIKELGGLKAAVIAALGEPLAGSPRDGDIALLPSKLGGLCIVYGAYAVGPSTTIGVEFLPFTDAISFWRVKCHQSKK